MGLCRRQDKMRFLVVLSLVGLALASTPDEKSEQVNELMDIVESGLSSDAEGRAFFVTISLVSTQTDTALVTVTGTTTPSCFTTTAAIPECVARRKRADDIVKPVVETKPMVTRSDGKPASLEDVINPTEVLESGTLSWREMKVQGLSSCGRSNKRARILAIENGSTTSTSTSTSTTLTSAATVTFTVIGVQCTSAGYTFGVPAC